MIRFLVCVHGFKTLPAADSMITLRNFHEAFIDSEDGTAAVSKPSADQAGFVMCGADPGAFSKCCLDETLIGILHFLQIHCNTAKAGCT